MRSTLEKHNNQYVLCKGWITDWERIDETTFRAYITKPTIKKPNKDVVFDELETISVEHHINLFVKHTKCEKIPYKKYDCVVFAGIIRNYRRKNGTTDYGVYPMAHSSLHKHLKNMAHLVNETTKGLSQTSVEALIHLETNVKPYIAELENELKNAGDYLPTFYHNYSFYEMEIKKWKQLITEECNKIRTIHSNRKLRRRYGLKDNQAAYVPTYDFEKGVANMRKSMEDNIKKTSKK